MVNKIQNDLLHLYKIADLEDRFSREKQIKLVKKIVKEPMGAANLLDLLIDRRLKSKKAIGQLDGIIFKHLQGLKQSSVKEKIKRYFQTGIVRLESAHHINYRPLYKSLLLHNFQEANRLTQIYLHELAGLNKNNQRQWLYFTDVLNLPEKDLKTIDSLWKIHSEGIFGFSIQRKIWLNHDKNWDKFWHIIGWKINKKNARYPSEFIWDNSAPIGHLPLCNQLRGVQVLATLFMHPAWE